MNVRTAGYKMSYSEYLFIAHPELKAKPDRASFSDSVRRTSDDLVMLLGGFGKVVVGIISIPVALGFIFFQVFIAISVIYLAFLAVCAIF